MSQSVKMPALGESVTEGTVTRWLKAEGDEVAVDEPLLEVSTDKVDTEIPSPVAGVLEKILVAEDETAEVGADLATIGDGSGGGSESGSADTNADTDAGAEAATGDVPEESPPQDAEKDAAPEPEATTESAAAPVDAPSTDTERPAEKPTAGTDSSGGSGTSVTLPAMGESVTEGTVTRWLKAVGDEVAVDEPLLEVSTDKVDTEVPSPVAGTLLEITVAEDETIQVGGQLAVIGAAGSAPADTGSAQDTEAGSAGSDSGSSAGEDGQPDDTGPAESQDEESETEPTPAPSQPQPSPAENPDAPTPVTQQAPPAGTSTAATQAQPAPSPTESLSAKGDTGGAYVTPVIRKLATDNGVDLSAVHGTGVGGRIRREDVVRAAEAAKAGAAPATASADAPQPAPSSDARTGAQLPDEAATALIGTTQKTPRIRQTIARNMVNALQTAAQLTSVIEVDVTRVATLRARAKRAFEAREGVKLSFLPFFVKAAVEAARVYPVINSTISDDLKEITYHPCVNLGIAVDTPRGLVVPVIKNADDLNISGIARKVSDLADRTRNNKIGPDELSGGTFSLTNTGSVGALFDTAIFTPPQSAILITGAVVKRAVVVPDADGNDTIAIRSMAYLALSYDHRNVDGADAARFLAAVKKRIEGGGFEGDLGL